MAVIEKKRLLWVDIYKALAIILVVIGHATGKYNVYIYQFHLAAFFLISGYVTKQKDIPFLNIFCKRLYSIYLPLFSFLIINAVFMAFVNYIGKYDVWFGEYSYVGIWNIVKYFILSGSIYTWWLGAAWFLIVLFLVSLLSKALFELANEKMRIYIIYTLFVYIVGYYFIHITNYSMPYNLDLVLIAQFFYCVGYIIKCKMEVRLNNINLYKLIAIIILTTIVLYQCGNISNVTIDYAARSFNNIFINTFTCLNGICWLFAISKLIERCNCGIIIKGLTIIGQNTLGILLLHFFLFKISYIILYFTKNISKEQIALITPQQEIGAKYWWLITFLSILASVVVWCILRKNSIIATLFGLNGRISKKIEKINLRIGFCKEKVLLDNKKVKLFREILSNCLFIMCLLIMLIWGEKAIYNRFCSVNITFPNIKDNVEFSEGWLEQGTENYRWIKDFGKLKVKTYTHNKILIEGYVPENFEEVTMLEVYVNGEWVGKIDTKKNSAFSEEYDISGLDIKKELEIVLDFNGVHEPDKGTGELRSLSGLIQRIYIE